ncbi:class GN sortase [Thalassotalea sediminis]|uniref:class GN sortase n=1 Tax=Thalassotalea sediminis TaxID=1759089 RepID=UPI002573953E|nr:class GN sortase [Thalassotalea sediminis]
MFPFIKQTPLIAKWRLNRIKLIMLCGFTISTYLLASSGYIHAKALLAQVLIKEAWIQAKATGEAHPPWSWADTYPVAKITLLDKNFYLLAGATGRTLAFGPGHMSSTPLPGKGGNTVIAGHRDTHFANLANITIGDIIKVETRVGQFNYQVTNVNVVNEQNMAVTAPTIEDTLTLITCFPFDAIAPNTTWRYVVTAALI